VLHCIQVYSPARMASADVHSQLQRLVAVQPLQPAQADLLPRATACAASSPAQQQSGITAQIKQSEQKQPHRRRCCCPRMPAVGKSAASPTQCHPQSGFYLEFDKRNKRFALSRRLLRTLLQSHQLPRQLQVTVPGAAGPLPLTLVPYAADFYRKCYGWTAVAAALTAHREGRLQHGSVLHISRPAGSATDALQLRLVEEDELTADVRAAAALMINTEWNYYTGFEVHPPLGTNCGSEKRKRSDSGGTDAALPAVKRHACDSAPGMPPHDAASSLADAASPPATAAGCQAAATAQQHPTAEAERMLCTGGEHCPQTLCL
jgi:hypothetical protein